VLCQHSSASMLDRPGTDAWWLPDVNLPLNVDIHVQTYPGIFRQRTNLAA
jgi:hypothetical protein